MEKTIVEEGERAAFDAGVSGIHPEVIKKLGRLKYRTSYGQNQLAHAVEVAQLAGVIGAELGADVGLCKAGGLLHDLGKAMDHEVEGTHAAIGAEFARRHGVNAKVVNAIASHHHEIDQESVEAVIVEAADAISGARPGARRESLEQYIKRVRGLEEIANSFVGVQQSFALQAGREIRVIVTPEDIDDLAATRLARDVAKKIEEGMQYPGQIKVTVIRETQGDRLRALGQPHTALVKAAGRTESRLRDSHLHLRPLAPPARAGVQLRRRRRRGAGVASLGNDI